MARKNFDIPRQNKQALLESSNEPKLATVGYHSSDAFAPPLWNSLPLDIRSISNINTFKKRLKTHLFIDHYSKI